MGDTIHINRKGKESWGLIKVGERIKKEEEISA